MKARLGSMVRRAALAAAVLVLGFSRIGAEAATPLPTDVPNPSSNCVFLGIKGKYIEEIDKALKRINEIRLEACKEGVLNPATKKPLTKADYVPIKWSSDLEYIARIRAAEASVTMDHARVNGRSIWDLKGPKGGSSSGEVIAWNWTETMLMGIEQWYGEKEDWVAQNPYAVTGHYTQMIDPGHLYVGIGTFCSGTAKYYNTTAGEFSYSKAMDETKGSGVEACVQTLEVNKDYLSHTYEIAGAESMKIGEKMELNVTTSVTLEDYWGNELTTSGLLVLSSLTWSSSDTAILSVDAKGVVTANKCGAATITAKDSADASAKIEISVEHEYSTDWTVDKPATISEDGSKSHHCTKCSEKKDDTPIKKIDVVELAKEDFVYNGEKPQPGVIVKDSDKKTIGSKYYTVSYPENSGDVGAHTVDVTFKDCYSGKVSLTYRVAPKAPEKFKAAQTTTKITLTWESIPGVAKYKVYQYDPASKKYVKAATVSKAKAVIKKLKAGTEYRFQVVAFDATGKLGSEASKAFVTATKCNKPKLVVSSPAAGKAKLTWNKVSGATGYTLYYRAEGDEKFQKLAVVKGLSYTCDSLESGETYDFKAVANKKVGKTTIKSSDSTVRSVKVK